MERQQTGSPAALPHVQEVLRAAQQELTGLLQQRAELMKRIGTIRQTLAGIANLFGDSILSDDLRATLSGRMSDRQRGFTRACRQILMDSRSPVAARQGCEELTRRFPEMAARHKELLASVTTVFHRLALYGEARSRLNENGVRVWEWISDLPAAAARSPAPETRSLLQPQPPEPA